jgi:phosphoglycolate phosphatase-like HAD superfamily hydrolase|tara:strand:- start:611 stop:1234 length:624 start_codon:yes stop_codon:yes gene_type:complete
LLKGIIFDFDGVIVESVQVKSNAFAEIYKPYGPEIVKKVINHHEANGGMPRFEKFQFYHKSLLNKPITEKEISAMSRKFSNLVVKKVIDASYVPGASDYIKKSYDLYKLFISTGTPTDEIRKILAGRKITKYFTEVFGSPEKKTIHVKNILKKYNLKPNELIFYGDSNSDMQAAHHHNVPFILRLHQINRKHFGNYTSQTIENFLSI